MVTAPPPRSTPRVAVVTVSYGSAEVLLPFLDSVPAASISPVITVVADNKPDGDADASRVATDHGATYLRLTENKGYGGGMNAAAADLPGSVEWILVSNPDVVLGASSIDRLVAAGDADPLIGAVGPAVLTPEGVVYPSARSIPSLRTGVGHALFANLWGNNPWTRAYRNDGEGTPEPRDAGWLSGSCVLVRRSAFVELGGFDDSFFMYFEDVDLGYRLTKAGYRNIYFPAASVVHSGAHATTKDSALMVQAHHDSAKRFLKKKYRGPLLWPIRAGLGIGLSVRSALVTRRLPR